MRVIIFTLLIFSVFADIPNKYDYRTAHPECPHKIVNQGGAGSVVPLVTSQILSDRMCLATKQSVDLSANYISSCCFDCGHRLSSAFTFLQTNGTVTSTCSGRSLNCITKCVDGSTPKFYKAKSFEHDSTIPVIQKEIYDNGPVTATFTVYQDFMTYTGGIYVHRTGSLYGEHAAVILGWGYQGPTNYWICANTWGPNWGENGYFRIAFNTIDLEQEVFSVVPDV